MPHNEGLPASGQGTLAVAGVGFSDLAGPHVHGPFAGPDR